MTANDGAGEVAGQVTAAREAVLVVRRGDLGAFVVRGPDRTTWLNGLLTCDVLAVPAGGAAYGLAVTQKGRILADVVVLPDGDRVVVVAPAALAPGELTSSLERYLIMEDVVVETGARFVVWEAFGKGAGAIVDAARGAGAGAGVTVAAALDRTGLGGGAIVVAEEAHAAEVERALADAARGAGGAFGDDAGFEALRLELAVPRFGKDFDATTYPQEATLEKRAVSFQKGCYLGQEVVCMLELRGHVKRRLVPLAIDGDALPAKGAQITDAAGAKVGEVTSAVVDPRSGRAIALAMLKVSHADSAELRVDGAPATVRAPT